ncbi:MAG: ATP-NAD kinase family protein [Candidatus Lokiarchaeota archaeon]|nr:ATP-NAD kinase family protein [Candidatus Lokiarchaeota archaeon]
MIRKEFTIGLVVNPVAGMGGSVGLKGTDGQEVLGRAIQLGAIARAPQRARDFVDKLLPIRARARFVTPGGIMGGSVLDELDPVPDIHALDGYAGRPGSRTTGEDTSRFVAAVKGKVDVLAFAGGDGTARDVLDGMARGDGEPCPVIGIPAGVKIHSGVFGLTPAHAALVVLKFLSGEIGLGDGEVMDIDEAAFREGRVEAKLYGYLRIPVEPAYVQGSKQGAPAGLSDDENKDRIAEHVVSSMEPGTCYVVGPGSTTKPIFDKLGLQKTLLGVDAVMDGELAGTDLNESGILALVDRLKADGKQAKIVVTVIGKQGFLFGRGNLQFSPAVIRAIGLENIIIVLTRSKLASLPDMKLRNDTRDATLDAEMRGLYRVLVDESEYKIVKLE